MPRHTASVLGTLNHTSPFQKKLLLWFSKHKRPLPWRLKADPYRIFVVEVMLQQTQIKTVIPYYERWLKAFPNVHSLARAPLDRVLKLWEGLGYYTRARNLHKTAIQIVENFGGELPSDPELLRTLPGIGKYTAGAIASIAFQKPVPLVDGNVARVLSRLFNLKEDISKPATQDKLYELATSVISHKDPGAFNQALMELGSLVCIPEAPRCAICPVRSFCLAFQNGDPSSLPTRSKGPEVKKIKMAVGILTNQNKLLVRKRPERGIWGGLWEIPGTVCAKNQTPEEALKQEFQETLGIRLRIQKKMLPLEHRFTHREALIYPFRCVSAVNGKKKILSSGSRWANRASLKSLSFPVPHQKILKELWT